MWLSRREVARILKESKRLKWRVQDLEEELHAERKAAREREAALRTELAAEREANRQREERLLDRVLTSKDARPVTDPPQRPKSSAETAPLSGAEEAEMQMFMESAAENGYGREVGRKFWYRTRAARQAGMPEPTFEDAFAKMEVITT